MDKLVRVVNFPSSLSDYDGSFKPGSIVWAHQRNADHSYEFITLDRKHTHFSMLIDEDGRGKISRTQRLEWLD